MRPPGTFPALGHATGTGAAYAEPPQADAFRDVHRAKVERAARAAAGGA